MILIRVGRRLKFGLPKVNLNHEISMYMSCMISTNSFIYFIMYDHGYPFQSRNSVPFFIWNCGLKPI